MVTSITVALDFHAPGKCPQYAATAGGDVKVLLKRLYLHFDELGRRAVAQR